MTTVSELMAQNITNAQTNVQNWGRLIYAAKVYNLKGDGTTDDYTKLYALINTTINSEEATIGIYDGDYVIGTNITIPTNITLMFFKGGTLKPAAGVTVTINGSIEAGAQQIFSGSGTIAGEIKSNNLQLEWWGAVGDNATVNTTTMQSAVDYTVGAGKSEIYVSPGTFLYGVLTSTSGITFIGDGVTFTGTTTLDLSSLAALKAETVTGMFNVVTGYNAVGDGVTVDAANIQSAINAAEAAGSGTVWFPDGTYNLGTIGITVPANVRLLSANKRGVVLTYSGTGAAISCGGTTASLTYGVGIQELTILLTHVDGDGILLQGTAGAYLENLYIEGPLNAVRTNVGVVFDGSEASCFFNTLVNVQLNHLQTGFKIYSSGSVVATTQNFFNCQTLGDVTTYAANGSIGYDIFSGNGNGSLISGGNIERCQTAINAQGGSKMISFMGVRLELNTLDILFGALSNNYTIVGCMNLDTVTDNSGTGFGFHTFLGNTKSTSVPYPNVIWESNFRSRSTTNIPLTITAYPGQTGKLAQWKDSAGNVMFEIDENGSISKITSKDMVWRAGTSSPEGVLVANIGSIYSASGGSRGLATYLKERSNGVNTGWFPIQCIHSYTTANRPTGVPTGFSMFDTTLGYRIDWNGANWVNGSGTVV